MITVHHLQNSRSLRIVWLMEELGVPYEVKTYDRDPVSNLAPDAYRALHPLGKAPVVTVDDQTLVETGAIIEYFLDRYPQANLRPAGGSEDLTRFQLWMHASEGSLMPLLVMSLFFSRMETQSPFFIRPMIKMVTGRVRDFYLTPSTNTQLAFIESELGKRAYFAGDEISGADIIMSFPLEAASVRLGLSENYPNISAWLERIHARPAYKMAVEKAGAQDILT